MPRSSGSTALEPCLAPSALIYPTGRAYCRSVGSAGRIRSCRRPRGGVADRALVLLSGCQLVRRALVPTGHVRAAGYKRTAARDPPRIRPVPTAWPWCCDLAMVWLAWIATNLLRYSSCPNQPVPQVASGWASCLSVQELVHRQTGTAACGVSPACRTLWNILLCPGAISSLLIAWLFLYNRLGAVPRAAAVSGHYWWCAWGCRLATATGRTAAWTCSPPVPTQRVLVLGARRAGEAPGARSEAGEPLSPVGFVDDNPRGSKLHSIPGHGSYPDGCRTSRAGGGGTAHRHASASNADAARGRAVQIDQPAVPARCRAPGRRRRRTLAVQRTQEVAIEDLLRRDPVTLDWTAIATASPAGAYHHRRWRLDQRQSCGRRVARLGAASRCAGAGEYNQDRIDRGCAPLSRSPAAGAYRRLRRPGDLRRVFAEVRPGWCSMPPPTGTCPAAGPAACAPRCATTCWARVAWRAADRHGECFVLISTDKAVSRPASWGQQAPGGSGVEPRRALAPPSSRCVSAACWTPPDRVVP